MGPYDLIMAATGQPDPRMQLARAFGQGPGQPGNPGGPQPLAPPPGGPGMGAGGGPAQAPGGPGGAPGPQQQPPQPQAYTSPPDLANAYLQLQQRQQISNSFDRHLGMIAAGLYPGRRPDIAMQMGGDQQDTGAMFGNLLQLQQYQQSQQRYQDMITNPDKWAKALNMTSDAFKTVVMAEGPQGAGAVIGKIAEANAGVSGDPTVQEMNRSKGVYMAQNGITDPNDPRIPDRYKYPEQYKVGVQGDAAKEKEVTATQGNFQGATQAYNEQLKNVNELLDPKNRQSLDELTGWYNSTVKPTAQLSDQAQRMKKVYDTVMAGQFGSAVQDFPGSRISTKELVADAPSKSTMGLVQSTPDLIKATEDYQQTLLGHQRNLAGKAQQLGSLSDADYDQVDPIYKPGGDLGPKAYNRQGPAAVKTPGDVAALPAGRKYVLPDGSSGYAVHDPSDVARLPHGAKFMIPDGSGRIGTAP